MANTDPNDPSASSGTGDETVDVFRLPTIFHADHVEHHITFSDRRRNIRRGKRLKRWKTTREIGRGGFGIVYLQQEEKSQKLRAVKQLLRPASQENSLNPLRELTAMATLSKELTNFVEFQGWYQNETHLYIAMEYFEFGDLGQCVTAPLPEVEAQRIIFQVAEALEFMHEKHFTHRDLKPSNIFVVHRGPENWWVKVADFGVSKQVTSGNTSLHTSLTGDFMAPEILGFTEDSCEYTNAVDMWSLGCLASWLLIQQVLVDVSKMFLFSRGRFPLPLDLLSSKSVSDHGLDFVANLLLYRPDLRMSALAAVRHEWLRSSSMNDNLIDDTSSAASRDSLDLGKATSAQNEQPVAKKSPVKTNAEPDPVGGKKQPWEVTQGSQLKFEDISFKALEEDRKKKEHDAGLLEAKLEAERRRKDAEELRKTFLKNEEERQKKEKETIQKVAMEEFGRKARERFMKPPPRTVDNEAPSSILPSQDASLEEKEMWGSFVSSSKESKESRKGIDGWDNFDRPGESRSAFVKDAVVLHPPKTTQPTRTNTSSYQPSSSAATADEDYGFATSPPPSWANFLQSGFGREALQPLDMPSKTTATVSDSTEGREALQTAMDGVTGNADNILRSSSGRYPLETTLSSNSGSASDLSAKKAAFQAAIDRTVINGINNFKANAGRDPPNANGSPHVVGEEQPSSVAKPVSDEYRRRTTLADARQGERSISVERPKNVRGIPPKRPMWSALTPPRPEGEMPQQELMVSPLIRPTRAAPSPPKPEGEIPQQEPMVSPLKSPTQPAPSPPLRYNYKLRTDMKHRAQVRNKAAARGVSFEKYLLYNYESDFGRPALVEGNLTDLLARMRSSTPTPATTAANDSTRQPGAIAGVSKEVVSSSTEKPTISQAVKGTVGFYRSLPKTVSREKVRSRAADQGISYEKYMLYHFEKDFGSGTRVV